MASIKHTDWHDLYHEIAKYFLEQGDKNFCVPLAFCVLTGLPPSDVEQAFFDEGRKHRKGVNMFTLRKVAARFGYEFVEVNHREIIDRYPGVHKGLQKVTSHHPRRFPSAFKGESLWCWGTDHSFAIKDGELVDWSVNRAIRAYYIYRIQPLEKR